MLETKLAARRASLSDQAALIAQAIAIQPLKPSARFSLRVPEGAATDIGTVVGFALDQPITRMVGAGDRVSARLGPDEWLLIGSEAEAEAIGAEIEAGLSGRFHSLVDIGHRNVGIEVSGRHAAAVLNAGCPIDLGDGAFPVGAATRTLLGKAEVVLIRSGASRYRVECWRSFAVYVHGFLREAARDFEHL